MDYAAVYGQLHASDKRFPGYSLGAYVDQIAELVDRHQPTRLLDYGSGKGFQYLVRRYHERWGGLLPHCFDPGVRQLSARPEGTFGGVICTDVLEHIERDDVHVALEDMLGFVEPGGFLFLAISCRPTRKRLPDGRDVHVTIEPPRWWAAATEFIRAKMKRSDVKIVIEFDLGDPPHFDTPVRRWEWPE